MERKDHWETVYETKQPSEVSWTQERPTTSLDFIRDSGVSKSARIIDIGGGDSKLVDFLIEEGYTNISVLDISGKSLERAKLRLGDEAKQVEWIVSDVTRFNPDVTYDLWHDRAAFHFLTAPEQISKYIEIAQKVVTDSIIIGTFSENGPLKCSGLEIQQYTETALENLLSDEFIKVKSIVEDHLTPFGTLQNFLFCNFKRRTIK